MQPAANADQAQLVELLAQKYGQALASYFGRRARRAGDIDDLVQDVLIRLAIRGDGDSIAQPEAYLMRTASNVWRDYLRKARTHAEDVHDEYLEERHARADHGPSEVLEGRQAIQALLAALNELPERTRQVFVLCRVEGLRQKSVAKRLGVSLSAVEKHMIKAIAHLALRLDEP